MFSLKLWSIDSAVDKLHHNRGGYRVWLTTTEIQIYLIFPGFFLYVNINEYLNVFDCNRIKVTYINRASSTQNSISNVMYFQNQQNNYTPWQAIMSTCTGLLYITHVLHQHFFVYIAYIRILNISTKRIIVLKLFIWKALLLI